MLKTTDKNTDFSENDWNVLSEFWHPVALSAEVGSEPVAVTLLDSDLVAYRNKDGLVVSANYCPHRGTRLSHGSLSPDGDLICPYHGLHFGAKGQCTSIPSAPDAKIPKKLCLDVFQCDEKYGLIWVCLADKPRFPIPTFDFYDDTSLQKANMSTVWEAAAGRHIENFCDTSHFSFTHLGTFGDPNNPVVEKYKVEERDNGIYYEIMTPQQDGSVFQGDANYAMLLSEYELFYPFAAYLKLHFPRGIEHIVDVVCPISAEKSRIFMVKARDHDMDLPANEWVDFQAAVNEEDRLMVESQRPVELPIDLSAEFHIAADAFSVAYRRKLKEFGLEGPNLV